MCGEVAGAGDARAAKNWRWRRTEATRHAERRAAARALEEDAQAVPRSFFVVKRAVAGLPVFFYGHLGILVFLVYFGVL